MCLNLLEFMENVKIKLEYFLLEKKLVELYDRL